MRKSIALCQEIKEESYEAIGHQVWGRVLAYQSRWQFSQQTNHAVADKTSTVENELTKSTAYWKSQNNYQGLSTDSVHRALASLLQARLSFFQASTKENTGQLAVQALQQAGEALAYAEKDAQTVSPKPREFVRAYWLLGEALLQCLDVSEYGHLYQSPDPHFYDGIPEAAMLKRGMTQQERIDNGYWVAYQIALAMEQPLAA